jgi:hypothetical protein
VARPATLSPVNATELKQAPYDEEPHPAPRSAGNGKGLTAGGIDRWLIKSGFARRNGAGLQATGHGLEVAAALELSLG